MCFKTLLEGRATATKLTRNMSAYKCFKVRGKVATSPYRYTRWTVDDIKTELSFKKKLSYKGQQLSYGFHALLTIKDARNFAESGWSILKVTIPKGSYIFKNETQVIASSMKLTSLDKIPKREPKKVQ